MRSSCSLILPAFLILGCMASDSRAQAGGNPQQQSQECADRTPSQSCTVTIARQAPATPEIIRRRNAVGVTIVVAGKSPFEACELNQERTAIEPEQSPLEKFLTSLTAAGVPFVFGHLRAPAPTGLAPGDLGGPAAAANPIIQTYVQMINRLRSATDDWIPALMKRQEDYKNLSSEIDKLRSCPGGPKTNCSDDRPEQDKKEYFVAQRGGIVERLRGFTSPKDPEPSAQHLQDLLDEIRDFRKKNQNEINAAELEFLRKTDRVLVAYTAKVEAAVAATKLLGEARASARASADFLESIPAEFTKTFPAIRDRDARIKATVTCQNRESKKVTMTAVPLALEFRDPPRLSLSLGVLASMIDPRQVGTTFVAVGESDKKKVFAENDRSNYQLIPFAFLDWRIPRLSTHVGRTPVRLHLSEGFGINPNSGGKDPEFFHGAAVGLGAVHLHVGVHQGKVQELGGGFRLGQTVPSDVTVPVSRKYVYQLGIGISYKIPVP